MRQAVDDDVRGAVLLQLLPVRRPLVHGHDGRDAALPQPPQGSLVRDDELQRHRSSPGPPDHHRVQVDVDGASDAGAGEGEVGSAVHDQAAPVLLPEDPPQTAAVDPRDLHVKRRFAACYSFGEIDGAQSAAEPSFPPGGSRHFGFM